MDLQVQGRHAQCKGDMPNAVKNEVNICFDLIKALLDRGDQSTTNKWQLQLKKKGMNNSYLLVVGDSENASQEVFVEEIQYLESSNSSQEGQTEIQQNSSAGSQ